MPLLSFTAYIALITIVCCKCGGHMRCPCAWTVGYYFSTRALVQSLTTADRRRAYTRILIPRLYVDETGCRNPVLILPNPVE